MLATALEAEIGVFLDQVAESGCRTAGSAWCAMGTVRSGRFQTGIGPARRPASRDVRDRAADTGDKVRFTSDILPRWARRSLSLDVLLPVSLPARHLHRRLPGGVGRAPWPGRAEPVAGRHLAADRRLGAGARALAAPRSLCTALRLHLGRRRLPAGPDGARGRVHPRRDRGDTGGQEGTHGLPCRHARERAELARAAGRSQGAGSRRRASDRGRRRRSRLLEGARRGLPRHRSPALLGAQGGQRAEQGAEIHGADGEVRPARHLAGRDFAPPPRPPWRPLPRSTGPNTARPSPA